MSVTDNLAGFAHMSANGDDRLFSLNVNCVAVSHNGVIKCFTAPIESA
jgi:hypothetical protein